MSCSAMLCYNVTHLGQAAGPNVSARNYGPPLTNSEDIQQFLCIHIVALDDDLVAVPLLLATVLLNAFYHLGILCTCLKSSTWIGKLSICVAPCLHMFWCLSRMWHSWDKNTKILSRVFNHCVRVGCYVMKCNRYPTALSSLPRFRNFSVHESALFLQWRQHSVLTFSSLQVWQGCCLLHDFSGCSLGDKSEGWY